MKKLFVGTTALTLACVLATANATAQEDQEGRERPDRERARSGQQTEGQQAVRGTVAGVTTVGEAVIDPSTNTAVVVEVDYLTVLGSPTGARERRADRADDSQDSRSERTARRRENVYLVAITPETTVREGRAGQRGAAQREANQRERFAEEKPDHAASKAAFQKLEIGDRVTVRFAETKKLRKKSGSQSQQTASGESKSGKTKHGRNRIVVGEASSVTVLPERTAAARNPERDGEER